VAGQGSDQAMARLTSSSIILNGTSIPSGRLVAEAVVLGSRIGNRRTGR
jgi:hypothetical protein